MIFFIIIFLIPNFKEIIIYTTLFSTNLWNYFPYQPPSFFGDILCNGLGSDVQS